MGTEDAVAPRDAVAGIGLAGAGINDVGVGLADGDGADGGERPALEDALPRFAVVGGLPHAAAGRADVLHVGVTFDDGDGGAVVVVVVATAVAVVAERWRVMTVGAPLAAVAQWRERRRRQ